MNAEILKVHATIGTPEEFRAPAQAYLDGQREVLNSRFEQSKKIEELGALEQRSVEELAAALLAKEHAVERERDRALAQVLSEDRSKRDLPAKRVEPFESDTDYSARVSKHLARLTAQATRASLTAADVSALQVAEPAEVDLIVDEAFASADPDAIRRVTIAAIARLKALETEDRRANPNRVNASPVTVALAALTTRVQAWRRSPEGQTLAERQQAIQETYDRQKTQLRSQAGRLAESFGWDRRFSQALQLAAMSAAHQ